MSPSEILFSDEIYRATSQNKKGSGNIVYKLFQSLEWSIKSLGLHQYYVMHYKVKMLVLCKITPNDCVKAKECGTGKL